MTRILVVDDDAALVRTLAINLRARGYEVEIARDGRTALQSVEDFAPDLVMLDLGLPDLDGVAVLTRIRQHSDLPVVVVSARQTSDDKVEALDIGADDYVTKPFGAEELMARIRAALRRSGQATQPGPIWVGDVMLDVAERRAERLGVDVRLTPTEWLIVEALAKRGGKLVRHSELLHEVWGPGYGRETNYLRVYMAQLRRKLEADPAHPVMFVTDPGIGYRLVT